MIVLLFGVGLLIGFWFGRESRKEAILKNDDNNYYLKKGNRKYQLSSFSSDRSYRLRLSRDNLDYTKQFNLLQVDGNYIGVPSLDWFHSEGWNYIKLDTGFDILFINTIDGRYVNQDGTKIGIIRSIMKIDQIFDIPAEEQE